MITGSKREKLLKKLKRISADEKDKIVYSVKYGLYDGVYRANSRVAEIFSMTSEGIRLAVNRIEKFFEK